MIRLPEFSSLGRITREPDSPVSTLPPIRENLLEFIRLLAFSPSGRVNRELDCLVSILSPISEDLVEVIRPLEPPVCGRVTRGLDAIVSIELPMREDLFEVIRLLELSVCGRVTNGLDVLVLIELPILEDRPELILLPELPGCGCITRGLDTLVLIELPIIEDRLELKRLLILVDDDLLLSVEMLEGLRALEVIPDRTVGRLTVVPPDRLLVVLLPVILPGLLLREEILLRPEDPGVNVLVGVLLIDREGAEALEDEPVLADEDCRFPEAEEALEACRLPELLWFDSLLLPDDLSAKTGLMVSIKAKNNVPMIILTFFRDFIVAIILLLKYLM